VYYGQTVGWIKNQDETWHGGRPRLGHIVLYGDWPSPPQKGLSPQFSARVRCGQTAGWIKMPLGVEVGLGPGDFVLDGDPASPKPKKGVQPPIFNPCLLWPNGWMDQDAIWYGGMPRHRRHCFRWEPAPPIRTQPRIFGPCLLWPNGRPSQLCSDLVLNTECKSLEIFLRGYRNSSRKALYKEGITFPMSLLVILITFYVTVC